ncbi:MAG: F0F1 ATP synthase subunit beta [Candidatus Omnitrophota bacterium]|nr:F0F1 ATP synthase subunit beta [Candidatus Omnitrophota bacterium]MBU1928713.1 F0F1 ATP synthase subunit beta [Candidatus Omnitrophota bacterium]MBU2034168.1 F0F1 ATP synthase subunit beta [Candidatus Omnitrophota bacterium]MBU2257606.1 F0F1 ATP synthase subunit beta [Candidatus Omnitrophota bacterium]
MNNNEKVGRVISVQGPVVDVKFSSTDEIPDIQENINTATVDGQRIVLEVAEHLPGNIARCIAINSTFNLQRNSPAHPTGEAIKVPAGDSIYGRIINVWGEPLDQKGPINTTEWLPIRRPRSDFKIYSQKEKVKFEILETGVKVIDLLFPLVKGSKNGILGGAALGKSILTLEIIHNIVRKTRGSCVFVGAGERIREGNELYHELSHRNILSRTVLIYGQMNEPPGARFEVAMSGVTLAESIQRKNQDVLLFVDNIFRFLQAGAEISSLLGRLPSETGYQPTLVAEASEFHERIRTTKESGGSITSIEAVYIPADDITDPAVVTLFSFMDSIMVLSRQRIQLGLYPAIDPLLSSSANLDPDVVGRRHYEISQEVIRVLQRYEELRRIVMVIGIDELSAGDRTIYERARKVQYFMTQPFFVAEAYTGKMGEYVSVEQTIEGCEKIISGHLDRKPENDFYMIGKV